MKTILICQRAYSYYQTQAEKSIEVLLSCPFLIFRPFKLALLLLQYIAGQCFPHNKIRAMFTIFTATPSERNILQQDFATLNDRFHISLEESPAIAGILRSITYEHFRSSPSELAQDVAKMAIDSLQLKLSLSLFREVMRKIRKMEELVVLFQDYFAQLSRIVDPPLFRQQRQSSFKVEEETSAIQDLQNLQQTSSAHQLINDFQDELQRAVGEPHNYQSFVKTRRTGIPEILEQATVSQKFQLTNGMLQPQDSNQFWWKQPQCSQLQNSSRELSHFQPHRPPLLQVSINSLLQDQVQFDQKREEQLHKKRMNEQSLLQKFTKNMRGKLLRAKLKRRRR